MQIFFESNRRMLHLSEKQRAELVSRRHCLVVHQSELSNRADCMKPLLQRS